MAVKWTLCLAHYCYITCDFHLMNEIMVNQQLYHKTAQRI